MGPKVVRSGRELGAPLQAAKAPEAESATQDGGTRVGSAGVHGGLGHLPRLAAFPRGRATRRVSCLYGRAVNDQGEIQVRKK